MKKERMFENPFTENFLECWQLWKDFRKEEHGFQYKGVISEQMAINRLVEVSEGDEEKAVRIVKQSISRGWMDFYQLKQTSVNGKSTTRKEAGGAKTINLRDRVSAALTKKRDQERQQQGGESGSKAV